MTHQQLEVNRWVAEQALMAARLMRSPPGIAHARKVLRAIDKRKSVAALQRQR